MSSLAKRSVVSIFSRVTVFVGLAVFAGAAARAEHNRPRKIPVVLDTDIGTDVDDAFALALVAASPELELRGVTTVSGDAYTRAMIACRLLHAVGHSQVPVAAGLPRREDPALEGQYQYGLRPSRRRPENKGAVELLHKTLKADPGRITLLTIGDLTNVAQLISRHPKSKARIKRIVLMGGSIRVGYQGKPPAEREWNIRSDVKSAQAVFQSGIPLVVVPLDATVEARLAEPLRRKIFATDNPRCQHLQALYELWGKETPTLFDAVAVTVAFDESFCTMEDLRIEVDDEGFTREVPGKPNCRVATGLRVNDFLGWMSGRLVDAIPRAECLPGTLAIDVDRSANLQVLGYDVTENQFARLLHGIDRQPRKPHSVLIRTDRKAKAGIVAEMMGRCQRAGMRHFRVRTVSVDRPSNRSRRVRGDAFPNRVHVAEDYETDIERRWWLAGRLVDDDASPRSSRACQAVLYRDFDSRMGNRQAIYRGVVFNPVPGPPMGKHTRLRFRFRLEGTDTLRVQIYSLSNGYHRHLTLSRLPQGQWRRATVDLTGARCPGGSGGSLSENERIDDIQFYVDREAELSIDDVLLYDAAPAEETRQFPRRVIFTAWFDTGRQGVEWPGDFEIVPHEKPRTWKAARCVAHAAGGSWIRLSLRGMRLLGRRTELRFRYRLSGADKIRVVLANSRSKGQFEAVVDNPASEEWSEATVGFRTPRTSDAGPQRVDEIHFLLEEGGELQIDDVLLYEPKRPEDSQRRKKDAQPEEKVPA
jgi:inosine-uridine nucleoside N-ribohydrolase